MAKIYRWVYEYERHNPQTGVHIHTAEVYETTIKKAEKVARRHCDATLYGSNYFKRFIKQSDEILLGIDVEQEKKYIGEYPRIKEIVEYRDIYPKKHTPGWDNLKEL